MYYDASRAPSYRSTIAQAASIWNSSVSNVRLVASSSASLRYYEGNDSRGSYYSGNGHGSGYVFIDYRQSQQYNPLRIVAHETGHALGLPDHYSGPCSELMSGGGPGPSCTNAYPNATERVPGQHHLALRPDRLRRRCGVPLRHPEETGREAIQDDAYGRT